MTVTCAEFPKARRVFFQGEDAFRQGLFDGIQIFEGMIGETVLAQGIPQMLGEAEFRAVGRPALGALRRIQKLPKLVRSFFRQPACQYVAI